MRTAIGYIALIALMATFGTLRTARADGAVCESKLTGKVMVLIVSTSEKVHDYASTLAHIPVVARHATTVVFQDGRVVTADVGKASQYLNDLGWASLQIEVVASFGMRPKRRRSFG